MNYESTFICSPELSPEKVEELTAKVKSLIESTNGSVKAVQQLGKKKLAYPINKFREGIYVYMEISGTGNMVSSIESFFKLNDSVIRYLTVKVEKKKVAPKATKKVEKPEVAPEVKKDEPTEQSASTGTK